MVLDTMRRKKKLLWGVVSVPLIFGLVAYLVPGMPGGVWGRGMRNSVLAKVNDAEISTTEFITSYQRFLRNNQYPYDRQFLKTLQIDRQILNQLISKEVILSESKRLGIDATNNEVQQKILALPYFQDNGNFLFNRYESILRQNGMTVEDFEDSIREDIMQEKLRNLITDSVSVIDNEIEEDYRNRNEKAKVGYVAFEPSSYANSIAFQESDLKAYFSQNREAYRIGEQRKVKYLFVDSTAIRNTAQVSDADLKSYYQQNLSNYQLPERVRASHILLKTEGKTPQETEQLKAKASEILNQAQNGGDFGELAKKYSEDTSAQNGGDLGFFGRGQMVPEFEKSAFSLGVGAISDLVTTKYGFHIVKVLEKQAAHTQTFEEVVNLIRPTLLQRRADQAAQQLADKAFSLTRNNKTLEQVSTEMKLSIQETPLVLQGAAIPAIGNSQEFSSKIFGMKAKEIGSPVRIPNGFAIPQIVEVKPPYLPELSEVRPKVEEALKSSKGLDVAKSKAAEFAEKAKTGANFENLAKNYHVTVRTSDEFTRNGNIADLGASSPLDGFAFSAKSGDVSSPIEIGQKFVVAQLKEKKGINREEFEKSKSAIRESLLVPKRDKVFQAYVDSVKDKMTRVGKIHIDEVTFAEVTRRI